KGVPRKLWQESRNMWNIAFPAIITSVAQFSVAFVTAAFVGHIGGAELAAVSVVQNVLEGFVYGIMLGLGSALETLCGQAVGAGEYKMLGIYMQRSCIITTATAIALSPLYIFTSPILKLLRQSPDISDLSGKYALWIIPQLFAYAFNFPIQKFLQAQSKVWVVTFVSVAVLGFHVLFTWIVVVKLEKGLLGAAMVENLSWWIMVLAQMVYVVCGFFPESWNGFSMSAFECLKGFIKLSMESAVMLCLEIWFPSVVILMVGWLKNPEIAVDAVSICMNIELWTLMIALGFNAAVSVRVSNELGANNPEAAKLSIVVAVAKSAVIGAIFTAAILGTRRSFPRMFSGDERVVEHTSELGYFLAATIFLNSIQPVLHGVAVGAGWQRWVAIVNGCTYYVLGLPLGAVLGYRFDLGVKGIWIGMLAGCVAQTLILLYGVLYADWHQEGLVAVERVKEY
ncbi:hypothetical protein M569_11626, partial [Genlisea aurea]